MSLNKFITATPSRILLASTVLLALYGMFGIYVYHEKEIDRANERRQLSFQLAGQLRQSSDDLTRMVRTYVATGEPRYKKYYQQILDIRNGKIPEPEGYAFPYWDLVAAGNRPPPQENGSGVALLDLMRQAGFTNEEFSKLASAKQYSDDLTAMEFAAMKLVDSVGANTETNRMRAGQMLYGAEYHQAKSKIMEPIKEFFILMDSRTLAAVNRAIYIAYLMRLCFIAASVLAIFILWRTYAALRKTLGASAGEIHELMEKIGQGDLSVPIRVDPGMKQTVLAGLAGMQQKLIAIKLEREKSNEALQESEGRYRTLVEWTPEAIVVHRHGKVIYANPAALKMFGANAARDLIGRSVYELSHPDYHKIVSERIRKNFQEGIPSPLIEEKFIRLDGTVFDVEIQGILINFNGEPAIQVVLHDITERKEHEAKLHHVAHFDALTGIPNRILLEDRMKQAIAHTSREQNMMAVCYLDLDGFKPINDELGHAAGDEVLINISSRIENTIRGGDTVARLGGDEFVVLLSGLEKGEECVSTLERLLAALSQPILVEGKSVSVSASIGVSIYPIDDEDPDILLRHADQAMYIAKQSGKNRFHIYDVALDRRAKDQNDILNSIRNALELGQMELHYQPKVNLQTRELVGAEALIRWRHPERGMLSPSEFLHYIENTDLDIVLGEWVTATALAQMSHWRKEGLDVKVSINISGFHLESTDFMKKLRQQLDIHPETPYGGLQIEVLETVALNDTNVVREIIETCRKIGIGFALDDFGTGYSSLSYLSGLPVDTIKIDQSFVRDMLQDAGDMAIVQGIIALARAFKRETVAEGVETEEQLQTLLAMGCEVGQGYGIALPMPAGEIIIWHKKMIADIARNNI